MSFSNLSTKNTEIWNSTSNKMWTNQAFGETKNLCHPSPWGFLSYPAPPKSCPDGVPLRSFSAFKVLDSIQKNICVPQKNTHESSVKTTNKNTYVKKQQRDLRWFEMIWRQSPTRCGKWNLDKPGIVPLITPYSWRFSKTSINSGLNHTTNLNIVFPSDFEK